MPAKPPSPCSYPGCPALSTTRFCEEHARQDDLRRGSRHERGYTSRWDRYRRRYLWQHPLCVRCAAEDVVEAATVVDHIRPHRGDQELFWDPNNHQALCKPCHDRKTATEDGGFGR